MFLPGEKQATIQTVKQEHQQLSAERGLSQKWKQSCCNIKKELVCKTEQKKIEDFFMLFVYLFLILELLCPYDRELSYMNRSVRRDIRTKIPISWVP